jgi:hypothetical protein
MSANNDPIFITRPMHWVVELNSQVFTRAGGTPTTPLLLAEAGDNGGVITSIGVTVTGIVAANVCLLFSLLSGGVSLINRAEVTLPAVTSVTNTSAIAGYPVKFALYDTEPFEATANAAFLKLSPGEKLYCALLQAETTSKFVVHATGGLYD